RPEDERLRADRARPRRRNAARARPRHEGPHREARRLRRHRRDAARPAAGHLPEGHPHRPGVERRPERRRHLQDGPRRAVRRLLLARRGDDPRPEGPRMIGVDAVKAGLLLFFVAIVQVSLLSSVGVAGGTPNLLLVTLVAVALLRGAIFGAAG